MKRIKACIITFSLMIALFIPSVVFASELTEYKENTEMLTALGILTTSGGTAKTEVTRRDFYSIICNMINCENTDKLVEMSIATVGVDGKIPNINKSITYTEAVTAMVKALGYGKMTLNDNSVEAYMSIASKIGLTDGVATSEFLVRLDMINLILNACEIDVMQLVSVGDKPEYTTVKGETVLAKYKNIYKVKGVLEEAQGISISSDKPLSKEYARIKDEVFSAENVKLAGMLGCEVEAYYVVDKKDSDKFVYVKATNKNVKTVVLAEDISRQETTKENFYYEVEGENKNKRLKLSKAADMIYNNSGYPYFTLDDLLPDTGWLEFIDNNDDGIIECIFVYNYKTIVVEKASPTYETITAKYTREEIKLTDYDNYIFYNGKEKVKLPFIKPWNVLYLMADKGNKNLTVYVSQESLTGEVTSYDKENNKVSIGETEYQINPTFKKIVTEQKLPCFEMGKSQIWYLDPDGRISGYFMSVANTYQYGYLFRTWLDETSDVLYMKILTTENEWVTFGTTKKVKKDVYDTLKPKQLVRYMVNQDSLIKSLEVATEVSEGSNSEKFRKMSVTGVYRTEDASFSNAYYMGGALTVFDIPTDYPEDISKYSANVWKYADYTSYTLDFYDPDENNCSNIIVYNKKSTDQSTANSPVFLVDKVTESVIGEEEVVQQIYGTVLGQQIQLSAKEVGLFDNIQSGDAIKYALNADGRVESKDFVYKASEGEDLSDVKGLELHTGSAIMKCRVLRVDAENSFIKVQGSTGNRVLKVALSNFAIYDRGKGKARKASISDVNVGDFAVIYAKNSKIYDVCLYREG